MWLTAFVEQIETDLLYIKIKFKKFHLKFGVILKI